MSVELGAAAGEEDVGSLLPKVRPGTEMLPSSRGSVSIDLEVDDDELTSGAGVG